MPKTKKYLTVLKSKLIFFSVLVLPFSTNYKLEGFSLGGAGGDIMNSDNYQMVGSAGELTGQNLSGDSYDLGAGLAFVRQANQPTIATFDNPNNYYDKLHFVIDTWGNPSDSLYALAISPDDFTTTYYVKSDNTLGLTLVSTDYQTYNTWGGATGTTIIGLEAGTTYKIKIKARQGKFTETAWSSTASTATLDQQLTFDIDVSASDEETSPPYSIDLGDLSPGTVTDSTEKIWVDLETNANSGASVYVYGQYAGLYSLAAGTTIASVNGNLAVLSSGFGVQAVGASQVSGGPMTIDSLYDLSSDVVGTTDTTIRQIFLTASPLSSGRASFILKAKSETTTPAASDYTETLTVIAAAHF